MQDADEGEQAAGRVCIDLGLAFKPLLQHPRPFVVNPAPCHIDGLDLLCGGLADRLIIAVADGEIIADRAAEAAQRQDQRLQRRAILESFV